MKYPWKLYLSLGLLPRVPVLVTGAFPGTNTFYPNRNRHPSEPVSFALTLAALCGLTILSGKLSLVRPRPVLQEVTELYGDPRRVGCCLYAFPTELIGFPFFS